MADQAFINSLAAAFAKEFAGSADPTLNKKIKDIRDEIAKAIGNINPGQLSTSFSGTIDISSLLSPSISNESYKRSARLRQDYDRLTKVLLNRVNAYVARTSKLLTGTIEIGSTVSEILGGDKKMSWGNRRRYKTVVNKLLDGIGKYVDDFAADEFIVTGQAKFENVIAKILNVDVKLGFWTRQSYKALVRNLLSKIGKYIDNQGDTLFEGKVESADVITSILGVEKTWGIRTRMRYNKLTRKLLDAIGAFVDRNGPNLLTGKLKAADIIPTLLGGDVESSWWTRRKFNTVRRNLLNKINDYVENGLQFKTDRVDALGLLDIAPGSLGDRKELRKMKIKIHESFFNVTDKFITNNLSFVASPQDVMDLLKIDATGFVDRAGIKQGFKQSIKAFFDRLKDHITNANIEFKSEFKFDPLELVTLSDTDKSNLQRRYLTAVERYMHRIIQKLEKGVINLQSLELPDNLGVDIAKTIAEKIKNGAISIGSINLQQSASAVPVPNVLPPPFGGDTAMPAPQRVSEFGTEERIFENKVIKTMIVDSNSRAIDFEKIFCGCIDKLGLKFDKLIEAFKMGQSPKNEGENEGGGNSSYTGFRKFIKGAKRKAGRIATTVKRKVRNVATAVKQKARKVATAVKGTAGKVVQSVTQSSVYKSVKEKAGKAVTAVKQKAGSMYNAAKSGLSWAGSKIGGALSSAKSGLSWVGSKIGGALSTVGRGFTKAKDVVVNSLSSAKKALFGKLSSFAGGAKGYLKYVFKIPIINTIFTAFLARAEIQKIIANSEMSTAQKEQAIGVVVLKSLGLLLGGAAGATLLSLLPGGTILGGVLGSMAGSYIAEWIGNNIDARTIGRLIIDVFGLNLGVTKETEMTGDQPLAQSAQTTSDQQMEQSAKVSAIPSNVSSSSSVTPTPATQVPKISNDYSPNIASSSKTAVSAIKSTKASDPIKQLNNTVQNLNKSIDSSNQTSIGTPAVPRGRAGNTGASKAFNGGGFREPAYNVRISAWSRLRPGSIMS